MSEINYNHLHYFWVVAREGSIAAACRQLHVTQPTISSQLRALERSFGQRLFERAGRGIALTETGRTAFRYADEIFSLGRELVEAVEGRPTGRPLEVRIGIADVLPKLVAFRLLEPALRLEEPIRLVCLEGKPDDLLGQLAVHRLDVVLSDTPIPPGFHVRAYNHLLGESSVTVFAKRQDAARWRRRFPASLDGAPWLLPTVDSALRRLLDGWFEVESIRPTVVGEFDDSALINVFGQAGIGVFPAPSAIEDQLKRQYDVRVVGRLPKLRERFYAISGERRVKNPAVLAIAEAARTGVLGAGE